MDLKQSIGKRIREVREAEGLKQEELAKLTDITPPQISFYENGINAPSVLFMEQLSLKFNVDLTWLVTGQGARRAKLGERDKEILSLFESIPEPYRNGLVAALREVEGAGTELLAAMDVVLGKGLDMTDFRLGLAHVHAAFARTVHAFEG